MHDPVIGIDLGTTNSLVAIADGAGPRVLADAGGDDLMPSVVRYGADGIVVGREAMARRVEYPRETVFSVKRLLGRAPNDITDDLPYDVRADDRGRIIVGPAGERPEVVSSRVLAALRERASAALGTDVRRAVITVPAYFDDGQRQATRDAGRLAGLDVLRIVNEPTAAALAYGIGATERAATETVAVYDLGGGTFDITILRVTRPDGADDAIFEVLATAGDTHLGGDDVDQLLIDLIVREIREQFGTELHFPPSTQQALRQFSEAAKCQLSNEPRAALDVDLGDGRHYARIIERAEFDAMIAPWIERTITACARACRDANVDAAALDRVILVGGSTRIPAVRAAVRTHFEREPYVALDPDRVVAMGAAVQAAILDGTHGGSLLLDVLPLSLGIETVGGAVAKLIVRNTTVPARATEMFSTSVDGQVNIRIHVLQGERELVADCRTLAEFDLTGIPPMPAGIPQVEVSFFVDENGILDVSAVERRSGRRAAVQVMPRYGLTREEVDAMEEASYTHAREDMHAHRVIDLAVNARLDVKWIRDAMTRANDDLDDAYRAELESLIAAVEAHIDHARREPTTVDADAFHRAKDALTTGSVRLQELAIKRSLQDDAPAR